MQATWTSFLQEKDSLRLWWFPSREKKHRLIVFGGGGWQKAFHGSPLLQL